MYNARARIRFGNDDENGRLIVIDDHFRVSVSDDDTTFTRFVTPTRLLLVRWSNVYSERVRVSWDVGLRYHTK